MLRFSVPLLVALLLGVSVACGNFGGNPSDPAFGAGRPDPLPVTLGYTANPSPTGATKSYDLVVKQAPWELTPGVTVPAITYNGTVPGPTIRVIEGDTLRVTVKNELEHRIPASTGTACTSPTPWMEYPV
jgi:FtsP/CotA-like multicopper oxidase with cupredoxin domain